jgi:hypothetical protein
MIVRKYGGALAQAIEGQQYTLPLATPRVLLGYDRNLSDRHGDIVYELFIITMGRHVGLEYHLEIIFKVFRSQQP